MSDLSTLPKGDSAWLFRKAIERIMEQVSVLETNIGSSTTGNSANTQIIFNDDGTLRGDAGLVYNKTTDALTVAGLVTAGSATITGDLTVDTSTLKVDSTNDRVGIGTATPAAKLIVRDGTNRNFLVSSDATQLGSAGIAIGGFTDNAAGYAPLSLIASAMQFGIAGSTAMTLNSTGLGVGVVPAAGKFEALEAGTGSGLGGIFASTATAGGNPGFVFRTASTNRWAINIVGTAGSESIRFYDVNAAATRMTLDASGNLGIGIAPIYKFHVKSDLSEIYFRDNGTASELVITSETGGSSALYFGDVADTVRGGIRYDSSVDTLSFQGYNNVERMRIDSAGNLILQSPATPATLGTNGMLTVNATSNTNLRFSYRGSDGTTRVANITLA
jgi:hypothetical protein